ncbi:MAG: hypothetical protein N3B18_01835 [Desulfobacterota bacterium]|nr:hypothetical protein [Thermodesulfobacteriota bacterium]
MKKFLHVNHVLCTGCRLCELACSMAKEQRFEPAKARIRVHLVGIPEIPVPVISRHCDACGGKPACLKYCPAGCITYAEGNPKTDRTAILIAETTAQQWLVSVAAPARLHEHNT